MLAWCGCDNNSGEKFPKLQRPPSENVETSRAGAKLAQRASAGADCWTSGAAGADKPSIPPDLDRILTRYPCRR